MSCVSTVHYNNQITENHLPEGKIMSQTLIWLLIALVIIILLVWFFGCKSCGTSCESTSAPEPPQPLKGEDSSESALEEGSQGSQPATQEAPPEGEADDLKKISGVGPKLEQTLNGLGIYYYKQIAEFTEENVEWVDTHLKFKGRIERDNWIEQAKELINKS